MFSYIDHSILVINPFDHVALPRDLKGIDSMVPTVSPITATEYHRLQGPLLQDQTIELNSLVSVPIPTRRCYMPILSFVTDSNSLDIPIPLLCDWILGSSGNVPGCDDFCEALREPLSALRIQPSRTQFSRRMNRLFFRGNLSSGRVDLN